MRTPEETRDAWKRLNNPQTVEDYSLGISMAEIRQCPEIVEEVTACGVPPSVVLQPFDNVKFTGKQALGNFIDTLERVHADVYNKCFKSGHEA